MKLGFAEILFLELVLGLMAEHKPILRWKKVWYPRSKSYISWDGSPVINKFSFIKFKPKKGHNWPYIRSILRDLYFYSCNQYLIQKQQNEIGHKFWKMSAAPTFSSGEQFSNNVTWRRTGVPDRKCVISKLLFQVFFDSFFLLWVRAYVSAVLPDLIFQKSIYLHFDFRFAHQFKEWQMHKWRIVRITQVKFDYPCVLWKGT